MTSLPDLPSVLAGVSRPSMADVWFRDVDNFRAGNPHVCSEQWSHVVSRTPNGDHVRGWASNGVRASDFFKPLKGQFMGK